MFKDVLKEEQPGLLAMIQSEVTKMTTQTEFFVSRTMDDDEDEEIFVPAYVTKQWTDKYCIKSWTLVQQLDVPDKDKRDIQRKFAHLYPFLEKVLDREPNIQDFQRKFYLLSA